MEGTSDDFKDATASLFQARFEDRARGETMAAAAERLRDLADVHLRARTETDLHSAARLLHEEQADLRADDAADVVDQVLAVLPGGPGRPVILAAQLRIRDQS